MPDTDLIENRLKPLRGDPLPEPKVMRTLVVDQNWIWRKAGLAMSLFFLVVVSVMTLTPMHNTGSITGGIDKIYHFVAFGSIIFPLILTDSKRWLWAVPALIGYGGLIELIQPSVGRSAEWLDFGADITGVMAGAALAELFHDRIHRSVFDTDQPSADKDQAAEAERREQMRAELREELRVVLMEELASMRHEGGESPVGPSPAEEAASLGQTPPAQDLDLCVPGVAEAAPRGEAQPVAQTEPVAQKQPAVQTSAQVFELPREGRRAARI